MFKKIKMFVTVLFLSGILLSSIIYLGGCVPTKDLGCANCPSEQE